MHEGCCAFHPKSLSYLEVNTIGVRKLVTVELPGLPFAHERSTSFLVAVVVLAMRHFPVLTSSFLLGFVSFIGADIAASQPGGGTVDLVQANIGATI